MSLFFFGEEPFDQCALSIIARTRRWLVVVKDYQPFIVALFGEPALHSLDISTVCTSSPSLGGLALIFETPIELPH